MKQMKRFLAFILAVVLTGNLMCSGMTVTATQTDPPDLEMGSAEVWSEDFEDFYDLIDAGTATLGENKYTGAKGTLNAQNLATYWNGANYGRWGMYSSVDNNGFVAQPSQNGGYNGSVGLKLTLDQDARVAFTHTLSADHYAKMIHGQTYTVRYRVKLEGWTGTGSFKTIVKITNNSNIYEGTLKNDSNRADTLTNGQWVQCEHKFVFHKDLNDQTVGKVKSSVKIELNTANTDSSNATLYFDDVSIEGPVSATAIDLPTAATVDTAVDFLELNPASAPVMTPANATAQWTSSNETVATVDNFGRVTGIMPGITTITATSVITTYNSTTQAVEYTTVTDTCQVTVTGEARNPYILFEEDFDDIYAFIDAGTAVLGTTALDSTGTKNGTNDDPYWNGANSGEWFIYSNNAGALIQPSKDGGVDDSGCVKITANGGRASVCYQLPASVYADMIEGAEYRVTAWYKAVDANKNPNIEIHNGNGNTYSRPAIPNGQWTKVQHSQLLVKGGSRDYFRIYLGQSGAGVGTYYIDNVTVERVYEVTNVDLGVQEQYLETGSTFQLDPVFTPADVVTGITYSSSDPTVATVSETGLITAAGEGTAVITALAHNGNVTGSCTVCVVEEYIPLESVTLNKTSLNVNPGHMEQLSVTRTPANASENRVIWASDDPQVAVVDAQGNILTLQTGTANITAAIGSKTAICTVTVTDAEGFASTQRAVSADFGRPAAVDLSQVLAGEYTVISQPVKGSVKLTGNTAEYTSNTWLMEADGQGFTDAVYTDAVKIAVKAADGKTAIITLNITINKLEELFYDESGNWITDVDMMFSPETLAVIKAEVRNNPTGLRAELVQNVLDKADSFLNSTPFVYVGDQEDSGESSTGDITVHFLMAYLLTKDMEGYEADNALYLQKTIQWVKASLGYPYWGTTVHSHRNSDRVAGHQLFSTAMVYFWLKEELADVTCTDVMGDENPDGTIGTITTTENMPILEALEKRLWYVSSQMYDHSLGYNVYVMNHLHIRFSGLLAATIALRPDAQTDAEKQNLINWTGLALYKNGIGMNAAMPDGTNQEGLTYWAYGTDWLVKTLIISEMVYGIDMFEMTGLYKDSPEFVLYMMASRDHWSSDSAIINMGDAYGELNNGISQILRFIAAQYSDATAQWLAQQFEDRGVDPKNTSIWLSAIFADTALAPVSPLDGDLDTLKWFRDLDMVISRSDWSGNEDILVMKTGVPCGKNLMEMVQNSTYVGNPDAGHAHPDANHITLYANGEYLLRDEGYACPKLTSNHNTLLVDGSGQLGEGESWMQEGAYIDAGAVPYMKVVEANEVHGFDYIVGDATEAYANALGLTKFERNIVYLKGEKVMLVVDNIRTAQDSALELRWFPGSKVTAQVAGMYMILSDRNVMNFYPFTQGTATTFEDVSVTNRYTQYLEKGFRQQYYGSQWQNAVAFSWDDAGGTAAKVRYLNSTADVHQFEVNGKIYSVNVSANEVTVTEGVLNIPDDGTGSDSRVSALMINGEFYYDFSANITSYTIDRWWKNADVDIRAFPNAEGGQVTVAFNDTYPGTITITGQSRDGTSTTVYTINVTNSQNLLGIAGVQTSVVSSGYNLDYTYDGEISETFREPDKFWVGQNLPAITFDMGKVVRVEKIDIAFHLSDRRDTYFDLLVSQDGVSWTTLISDGVAQQTPGTSTPSHSEYVTVLENAQALARYVRVQHRGHSAGGKDNPAAFNGIQEITIMGSEITQ